MVKITCQQVLLNVTFAAIVLNGTVEYMFPKTKSLLDAKAITCFIIRVLFTVMSWLPVPLV